MKSLVQVDDHLRNGGQIQVDNLVTALEQWLTTKVTEVIGRETIFVFFGHECGEHQQVSDRCRRKGIFEELGIEW